MSENYREIERKLHVQDTLTFNTVESRIMEILVIPKDFILTAQTIDEYWIAPGQGDFVRLRNSWGKTLAGRSQKLKEITVKKKDKGSNLDRLEINAGIESVVDSRAMLKMVLGKPVGRIDKIETVWFCPESLVVSLSLINKKDMFIEVEGKSSQQVTSWIDKLRDVAASKIEEQNLFEMYIQPKGDKNAA